MLRAFFERAESGQGQVVGLIGEPGVGKSRLVYEFRESLARPPVTYLEGHCLSSGSTTPYGPVLELIRQALGTSELDASPVIIEKVGHAPAVTRDRARDVGAVSPRPPRREDRGEAVGSTER